MKAPGQPPCSAITSSISAISRTMRRRRAQLVFALDLLVALLENSGKVSEALGSQALKPLCLGEENCPQSFAHFPLADNPRQRSDGAGTPGDADVWVLSLRENVRGQARGLVIRFLQSGGVNSRRGTGVPPVFLGQDAQATSRHCGRPTVEIVSLTAASHIKLQHVIPILDDHLTHAMG